MFGGEAVSDIRLGSRPFLIRKWHTEQYGRRELGGAVVEVDQRTGLQTHGIQQATRSMSI